MDGDVVSVERVIPASPGQVFELLADATRHQTFDGSGMVRGTRDGSSEPLRLGSVFGMSMKKGLPYRTVNEVIEYEENRRIAWRTRGGGPLKYLIGGRIWRYELVPVTGGTLVRETWDISRDSMRLPFKLSSLPRITEKNMARTLKRIERVVVAP
uniref:Dimethyladenosine transferase n=1 Tax=uncultured Nocardioidaceae bacterium TaxID=253824 RepID=A0A6J4MBL7_9ACTN|nr:MAG: hypothetical protein AVDCRST_MAG46-2900 [uncultured Nocardioidaceae bacterium]